MSTSTPSQNSTTSSKKESDESPSKKAKTNPYVTTTTAAAAAAAAAAAVATDGLSILPPGGEGAAVGGMGGMVPPSMMGMIPTSVPPLDVAATTFQMGLELQRLTQALAKEQQNNYKLQSEFSKKVRDLQTKLKQCEAKLLYYETERQRQELQQQQSSSENTNDPDNRFALIESSVHTSNHGDKFNDEEDDNNNMEDQPNLIDPESRSKDDLRWETNFAKLVDFKRRHGHCNYSTKKKDEMSQWVTKLRQHHRALRDGKPCTVLNRERIQRLNALGFRWRVTKTETKALSFEERLQQLAEYKAIHGHCNVPQSAKDCPPGLGNFVLEQRKHYKERMLGGETKSKSFSMERVKALEALGFQWRLRKAPKRQSQQQQQQQQQQQTQQQQHYLAHLENPQAQLQQQPMPQDQEQQILHMQPEIPLPHQPQEPIHASEQQQQQQHQQPLLPEQHPLLQDQPLAIMDGPATFSV